MTTAPRFQVEDVRDVWDEIQILALAQWNETARHKDIPLAPRREVYDALQAADKLRLYTMRNGDVLVAYAVFVVDMDTHYRTSKAAKQDALYLSPGCRSTGHRKALLDFCADELQGESVQVVCLRVTRADDFGQLLVQVGYEPIETIHAKRLDRDAIGA